MKIRVTISLDPTLWRKFRMWCLSEGKSASGVIEEWIKKLLGEEKQK